MLNDESKNQNKITALLCFCKEMQSELFKQVISMLYWGNSEVGSQSHHWKCLCGGGAFAATSKHKASADSEEAGGIKDEAPSKEGLRVEAAL